MKRWHLWTLVGAGFALAAVTLGPAAADWLVTKDGARVETQGPWRVESRLVVFKRPDGSFASMRLSDVDLEASKRVTREMAEAERAAAARAAETQKPAEEKEPIARLTEKDLPPVGSRRRAEEEAPAEDSSSRNGDAERRNPEPVTVSTWREVSEVDGDGLAFVGELRNASEHMALGVGVTVTLFDEEDEEIASADAVLTGTALPPGKSGGFRAEFPGVFHYVRADFDVAADVVRAEERDEEAAEPTAR